MMTGRMPSPHVTEHDCETCKAILRAGFPSGRLWCPKCGGYTPTEREVAALAQKGIVISPGVDISDPLTRHITGRRGSGRTLAMLTAALEFAFENPALPISIVVHRGLVSVTRDRIAEMAKQRGVGLLLKNITVTDHYLGTRGAAQVFIDHYALHRMAVDKLGGDVWTGID